MDAPVTLLGTRGGEVWVAGSHQHRAATAHFDGRKWSLLVQENFSWGVDWRAAFEAADGSLWFGAAVDSFETRNQMAGLLQFRNGRWIHHHQPGRAFASDANADPAVLLPATKAPEPVGKYYWLGESRDGRIWAGRNYLVVSDGRKWEPAVPWPGLHGNTILAMLTTRQHDLWLGTRQLGAVRFDGHDWQFFQRTNGLMANTVNSITQTADDTIWVATDHDISRFDGMTWTPEVVPPPLVPPDEFGALKASPSGGLWINRFSSTWTQRAWPNAITDDRTNEEFQTICFRYQGQPPKTFITTAPKKVSPPGDLSILWDGIAAWQETKENRLQFSYRLDGRPWTAYAGEKGHTFFSLPAGHHHFEVRARDVDFNVDPTPAAVDFVVLPPVWRQAWFIALVLLLGGLAVAQSIRVLQEQARLRKAQIELEDRVRERTAQLEAANKELESFSYSVSHDLRAPLRAIDGFSRILLEDYSERLDTEGRATLERVRAASQRMGTLIDDLLKLSRVARSELNLGPVNLSTLAVGIVSELREAEPGRVVEISITPGLMVEGDAPLLRILVENLLNNAWKFTRRRADGRIEFGVKRRDGGDLFFVRDNGAGFDMTYADKLFGAFQRLHSTKEFPGNGIGLATVQRIMHRHEGRVWAESTLGQGAVFYFTFPKKKGRKSG
jgi:signal transduction histidine kinase